MSDKYVPIAQRKKEELLELFEGFDIEVPEGKPTNKQLANILKENGITDKALKIMETEDQRPAGVEEEETPKLDENKCVVVMDTENASFLFKKYVFSRDNKYVLMNKDDAKELMSIVPGFRVASVEEVVRAFK